MEVRRGGGSGREKQREREREKERERVCGREGEREGPNLELTIAK